MTSRTISPVNRPRAPEVVVEGARVGEAVVAVVAVAFEPVVAVASDRQIEFLLASRTTVHIHTIHQHVCYTQYIYIL